MAATDYLSSKIAGIRVITKMLCTHGNIIVFSAGAANQVAHRKKMNPGVYLPNTLWNAFRVKETGNNTAMDKGKFEFIIVFHPINQFLIVSVDLNQAAEAAL